MAYKIYVDAGHGGYDNGAQYNGRREKDDALKLALTVGQKLEDSGFDVGYTRTTDVYQPPVEKAQIANRNGADLFVSIHRNSSPSPNTYSGFQTLLFNETGLKAEMARNINQEMEKVGYNDLGLSIRPNLAVLRATQMPALLLEVGFINTDADNETFDAEFDNIAQGIVNGIIRTLGEVVPKIGYSVQVGLYENYGNAMYEAEQLQSDGYQTDVIPWEKYFAVRVGTIDTLDDAVTLQRELREQGYDTLIVKN